MENKYLFFSFKYIFSSHLLTSLRAHNIIEKWFIQTAASSPSGYNIAVCSAKGTTQRRSLCMTKHLFVFFGAWLIRIFILCSVQDGHVEVARLLLDSGAQVNMPADSFESPLTLAACGGHVELAALLIERGANLEEVNDEGYTPLMEAAREGHEEMVALLLAQGTQVSSSLADFVYVPLCQMYLPKFCKGSVVGKLFDLAATYSFQVLSFY